MTSARRQEESQELVEELLSVLDGDDAVLIEDLRQVLREKLIDRVQSLLPTQQQYFTAAVPFLSSLKYIMPDGKLAYMGGHGCCSYSIACDSISELPIDSLITLCERMKQAKERGGDEW